MTAPAWSPDQKLRADATDDVLGDKESVAGSFSEVLALFPSDEKPA